MRRKKYDEQEFCKENTGYWRFWERFGDATILVLCNFFFILELWNVCTLFCNNDHLHFHTLARILYLFHLFWTKNLESSYAVSESRDSP